MNTSTADAEKRSFTVNKACVPCRARKVKCDAAVVGFPCSSCRSRHCVGDCTPLVRKGRTRKNLHASSTGAQTSDSSATSNHRRVESQSDHRSTPDPSNHGTEQGMLYLHILNDAGEETPASNQLQTTSVVTYRPGLGNNSTLRNSLSTNLSQLDEVDKEYLVKKGVFDLPPAHQIDALIKTYFERIHPLVPVINRVDFVRRYKSGDFSLLLFRIVLTTAMLHSPAEFISSCGFTSRSDALESFFSKARLLYDFGAGNDPLLLLQSSIILCMVMLDRPTDRDFGYWFHNAINLATKVNLKYIVFEESKPPETLKLYRRIWWTLYRLDVFNVFINTRRSRLLGDGPDIKDLTEDDLDNESVPDECSGLLSPVTPQQKASHVELGEMCRICGDCLSTVKSQPQQDPRQTMHSLDAWRRSLPSKIDINGSIATDVRYLSMQTMSYRFESILLRRIMRNLQRSGPADWKEWTKKRYRSVILELDTIAMRILASGYLEQFPTPLITTITALLALHIESALDPNETDIIRSMSRISISQTMLVLTQGRDIPVLKRALPIFEDILAKHKLYLVPSNTLGPPNHQVPAQPSSLENNIVDVYASPHSQTNGVSLEAWEQDPSLDMNFLGFDFLEDWQQVGQGDTF